jgi:carbamoyl-phosphate synthase L subunit-like protein
MKEVLVLNRMPLSRVRYRDWLGDGARVRVITSKTAPPVDPEPGEIHLVDGYDASGLVEETAFSLFARRPYDHIIALSEYDLLRAAKLRATFSLPGQSYASALAFRDKVLMKQHWKAAGLPITEFSPVDTATDLLAFAERHGFPIVVKPRRGSGSRSVTVLEDTRALRAWLAEVWSLPLGQISWWMAEKFVAGEMLHVDGMIRDGELEIAWPSTITSMLAFHQATPTVSLLLDEQDPAVTGIVTLVSRALRALPTPGFAIFHAEVWRTPGGGLVLNEIASRLGGGKIRTTIEAAFGTDMLERFVRGSVFPERVAAERPATTPAHAAGFVLLPPRRGTVPEVPAVPGRFRGGQFREAAVTARPGQAFNGAASSVEGIASCVAVGSDRPHVMKLLDEFAEWAQSAITYV